MFLDKKIMHAETKVRSDDKMRMKFWTFLQRLDVTAKDIHGDSFFFKK